MGKFTNYYYDDFTEGFMSRLMVEIFLFKTIIEFFCN